MSKLIVAPMVRRTRQADTALVVTQPNRNRRRRRRNQVSGSVGSGGSAFARAYANTMNDPFEYGGVPLGYDCFLPTSQYVGYLRGSFTVNSTDGSFQIVYMPDIQNLVTPWNGASGTANAGATLSASNAAAISASITEARVVSGGMRVMCLFPSTAPSGVLFSGTVVDFPLSTYKTVSTTNLAGLPGSHMSIGSQGATVLTRPYDNGSFEFFSWPVTGYGANIPYTTSGYIAGQGFPVGTTVWYEAVVNLEGLARTTAASVATPSDDLSSPTGASTWFPTPGTLLSAVRNLMSAPVIMDAVPTAIGLATGSRVASTSARALLSAFGAGRNSRNARSHESTVVIEEMKDDVAGSSYVSLPNMRSRR